MKTYQIHFIRHGEINENIKGEYIGTTDVPLSVKGIENLKKLDNEYKYPGAPFIYSSPLSRCVQTCNILYPQLKPRIINDLTECNFGDWEGKTAKELSLDTDFFTWLGNSVENSPPNGESGAEFTRRICLAFEKIVSELISSGETSAVIVTHGGVIMTLLSIYGIPQANSFYWKMDNGFGYSVRISSLLWMRDKVVEVYDKSPIKKEE